MAVFTELKSHQVQSLVERYDIGVFAAIRPIAQGIENTNYYLDTHRKGQRRHWILTVFEAMDVSELPYFCALTGHLSEAGLEVPAPVHDRQGEVIFKLNEKPGVIVPCLPGRAFEQPTEQMCHQLGCWLGRMHLAARNFSQCRPPPRDRNWIIDQSRLLDAFLTEDQRQLLDAFLLRFDQIVDVLSRCPTGVVHGDLFRDNVLFSDGQISGVIDFYHACQRGWLFDLAVAINDWTTDEAGHTRRDLASAMIEGYQSVRTWTADESASWSMWRELAAMQFWLSRLASKHLPGYQQQAVSGETIKDPARMAAIVADMQSTQL